jgi:CO dehydrogenase nickel-insertion accessory protein CooC1
MKPFVCAFLGKGGTGKTALSTLAGRSFIGRGEYPLFVDADPVFGLQKTLALPPRRP